MTDTEYYIERRVAFAPSDSHLKPRQACPCLSGFCFAVGQVELQSWKPNNFYRKVDGVSPRRTLGRHYALSLFYKPTSENRRRRKNSGSRRALQKLWPLPQPDSSPSFSVQNFSGIEKSPSQEHTRFHRDRRYLRWRSSSSIVALNHGVQHHFGLQMFKPHWPRQFAKQP